MSELITARIRAHALKLGLSHLAESVEVLLARAEAEQLATCSCSTCCSKTKSDCARDGGSATR